MLALGNRNVDQLTSHSFAVLGIACTAPRLVARHAATFGPCRGRWPGLANTHATNDKTPRHGERGALGRNPWRGAYPLAAKWPRSVFLKRASLPLVATSLIIAE